MKLVTASLLASAALACATAQADTIYWADLTAASGATVSGLITTPSGNVSITATGNYGFVQTSGGTNYWNPNAPYLSPTVSNAPPPSDIIALGVGGTEVITFSQPVLNPLIALVSWNGNTVDFGEPIQFLSYGPGYWGNGTPIINGSGTGFFGNGEVHGVVMLPGVHSSITFTHTSEYWHGFTVGVAAAVPEPSAAWLTLSAVPVLVGVARRRRARKA